MYGGMGVSAPSLHRESTDSLIDLVHFSSLQLHDNIYKSSLECSKQTEFSLLPRPCIANDGICQHGFSQIQDCREDLLSIRNNLLY